MLSSAPKSVPTTKQFRQPYFMDISPDGVILSTCARFAALLKRRNIDNVLGTSLLEVIPRLGKMEPALSPEVFRQGLPHAFDLTISGPGKKSFIIRWIPTPRYASDIHGGWQLTGPRIYTGGFPDTSDRRRPAPDPAQPETAASLIKQVSDIIITTDLEDRIIYWNNAAERFYNIQASVAIG